MIEITDSKVYFEYNNSMYKTSIIFILVIAFLFIWSSSQTHAQMIGNTNNSMMQGFSGTPEVTPTQQDLQDIQIGQVIYTKFQSKQVSCTSLQDADFEKIGEYLMNQQFGNTNSHIQMNDKIKSMMGDQEEERMHIAIGKSVTGCNTGNQQGGVRTMTGWNGFGMMNGGFGFGRGWLGVLFSGIILHTLICIDLILLGVWLWKQIKKNK